MNTEGLQTRPAAPRGLGARAFSALRLRAAFAWLRIRRAFAALRAPGGKRRLRKAFLVTAGVGALAITTEAVIRGHIVSPAARAPSALFTRSSAWAGGNDVAPVAIASIDPKLNELRVPVALRDIPPHVIDAVLAVEDKRFYDHHGFDARRIAGALVANVKAVGFAEGGSTITQQLAKNLFLTADKTPIRKLREAALAAALEIRHTKQEILEAYLNEIYLGQDGGAAIHGVGAAARFYFGKPVQRLALSEGALLAGMIRSPNRLAPTRHPRAARDRRNLVLGLMVEQKRVAAGTADRSRGVRVPTRVYPVQSIDARYFRDFVSASLRERMPSRGGAVYSTLDAAMQQSAERAVVRGLQRMRRPGAQASLVAIDPRTGEILAMVGGIDYGRSQFNRAANAKRQPGSTFKPFVALAALEAGPSGSPAFTLASRVEDEPLRVAGPTGDWQPVNYDGQFRGEVSFREALEQSLNVPFARIGMAIGPERIASTAQRLGVTSPMVAVPSIALGSSEVTLLELVRAYGVLATQGDLAETRSVTGRVAAGGTLRETPVSGITRVADPASTFLVTSALIGAVQRGTGRALDVGRFGGDVAGKTGTSSDWRDAWFVAYAPNIVVGVWVGYDDGRSLGLAGGAAAVPIVSEFFEMSDAPLHERFAVPEGIEEGSASGGGWFSCGEREYFLEGTAPAGGGCSGFRGLVDGFRRIWGDDGREQDNDRRNRDDARRDRERDRDRTENDRLRRIIIDKIRAEIEAMQHRR